MITDIVQRVTRTRVPQKNHPKFSSGDTVDVYVKVKEGEKERLQLFHGVVIKVQGSGVGRSFTVRKISSGVGVERTFPFVSPGIDRIEVVSYGKVRRSRLFYLRGLKGRAARLVSEMAPMGGNNQTPDTTAEVVDNQNDNQAPAQESKKAKAKK